MGMCMPICVYRGFEIERELKSSTHLYSSVSLGVCADGAALVVEALDVAQGDL